MDASSDDEHRPPVAALTLRQDGSQLHSLNGGPSQCQHADLKRQLPDSVDLSAEDRLNVLLAQEQMSRQNGRVPRAQLYLPPHPQHETNQLPGRTTSSLEHPRPTLANGSGLKDRQRSDPRLRTTANAQNYKTARQEEIWDTLHCRESSTRTSASSPHAPKDSLLSKIRRVAKPARIRVHWTCHQCDTEFGRDRACTWCGHRRCEDCIRSPIQRVHQEVISSLEPRSRLEQLQNTFRSGDDANEPMIIPSSSSPSIQLGADLEVDPESSGPFDLDNDTSLESDNIMADSQTTSNTSQPSSERHQLQHIPPGIHVTLHSCHTPFTPGSSPSCALCLHIRFPAPSSSTCRQKETEILPSPSDAISMPRVYKRPRQFFRFTCHQCQSVFKDHIQPCSVCGHQKCDACPKEPRMVLGFNLRHDDHQKHDKSSTTIMMPYVRADGRCRLVT